MTPKKQSIIATCIILGALSFFISTSPVEAARNDNNDRASRNADYSIPQSFVDGYSTFINYFRGDSSSSDDRVQSRKQATSTSGVNNSRRSPATSTAATSTKGTKATSTAATTTASTTPVVATSTATTSTTTPVVSGVKNTPGAKSQLGSIFSGNSNLMSTVLDRFIPEDVYSTTTFSRFTTFILIGLSLACGLVGIILASGKLEQVQTKAKARPFAYTGTRIAHKNQ